MRNRKMVDKPKMTFSDGTNEVVKLKTRSSSVDNPCLVVFETADAMPGAKRKDVIAACVEKGVAFYTARTQYQHWFVATRNSTK